ncbi:MAG: hypothetical protein P9M15_06270 [Candidatus Electryoneaceae bacterium]|nr:hypothetical protein [Candidatus Electryoneaceae bacterium]
MTQNLICCYFMRLLRFARNDKENGSLFPVIILFMLLCASATIAQQPSRYERKSISSPELLLISDQSVQLPDEMADYLLNRIKEAVEISRFDYNPLPDTLIRSFSEKIATIGNADVDDIIALLAEEIIVEIEQILTENMDRRAAGLVSPEEHTSWAVSKAKTLGITAQEIDKVLNSAYIYFPLITGFELDENDALIVATLRGTILWYNVGLSGEDSRIKLISSKKITSSKGFGWFNQASNDVEADRNKAIQNARIAAVNNFAQNMQVAVRQIPAFRIKGTLREIGFNHVGFNLGSSEGINLDDRYIITQFIEDEDGEIIAEEIGFVEVSRVGFNGTPGIFASEEPDTGQMSLSEARIVRGHGFDEGMNMVEFPRLGINIVVGVDQRTVEYGASDNEIMYAEDDHTKTWVGCKASIDYNMARLSGVSHLYTTFGFNFGFARIDAENSQDESLSIGTYIGASFGVMKKIPFRAFSFPIKASFGFQSINFAIDNFYGTDSYSAQNLIVGGAFSTGLEYIIGPAFSISFDVGWNFFTPSEEWSLYDEDGDKTETFIGPELNASGMILGMSIIYMPPTLLFNPWSLAEKAIHIATE